MPCSANAAPSEATDVVLATPPFWLATETIVAGFVRVLATSGRPSSVLAREMRMPVGQVCQVGSPSPVDPTRSETYRSPGIPLLRLYR
ncbi:hypothetical protein GCM10009845_04020 [Pedococcus bigeumensis]